jgi:hypothetical protein
MIEFLQDIDRELLLGINGSYSLYLDRLVRTLTNGLTWIPLYLSLFYMVMKNNDNFRRLLLVLGGAGLCILLAGTVDDEIVKLQRLVVPKRFVATVLPITATRFLLLLSLSVTKEPVLTSRERMDIYSGVTPITEEFQF